MRFQSVAQNLITETKCICGNTFLDDALFCRKCGDAKPGTEVAASPEDAPAAEESEAAAEVPPSEEAPAAGPSEEAAISD